MSSIFSRSQEQAVYSIWQLPAGSSDLAVFSKEVPTAEVSSRMIYQQQAPAAAKGFMPDLFCRPT